MRTDTLFYQLFLTFPHLVFELLKIPPVEGYQFCSREIIETALVYKLKNLSREEIEAMFTYDQLKDTRYFQDVKQEERLNLILRQLKRKLDNLPVELEGKIRNLSFDSLENLAEALLDFNSIEDLQQWLSNF